ncbi:hypothetical protein BRADI_2g04266v3 [Brachypodium distachyon]|uniref:Transmembrane protein n=1 Tax=Brachypodium distachyon TaxID=15368 RepID=A0A2K2D6W3_BRADI|nr:hypothetical protein BRADI_2g04266v3 [Brachypodium distachyon]
MDRENEGKHKRVRVSCSKLAPSLGRSVAVLSNRCNRRTCYLNFCPLLVFSLVTFFRAAPTLYSNKWIAVSVSSRRKIKQSLTGKLFKWVRN